MTLSKIFQSPADFKLRTIVLSYLRGKAMFNFVQLGYQDRQH